MSAESTRDALIELRLPSDPRYLSLVRTVVAAAASMESTLSDARVGDLKLVCTELFTNALQANRRAVAQPSQPRGDQPVSAEEQDDRTPAGVVLRCTVRTDEIEITVTDSGSGFDATDEVHPPVDDPRRLQYESGLGLPLIQYLADEVDYRSDTNGTCATVVLRNRA